MTNWWSLRGPERAAAKAADEARLAELGADQHEEAAVRLEQCFARFAAARKIRPKLRATLPPGGAYLMIHLGNRHVPIDGPEEFRAVVKSIYAWRLRRLRQYRKQPPMKAEGK